MKDLYAVAIFISHRLPKPNTLIVLIPGDGRTDIESGMYWDISSRITKMGVACCIWDKVGCGKSEGVYTGEQTIQNSAEEFLTALETLRGIKLKGIYNIGLWSISRGGWVAPLILTHDPSLAFWISVSGGDDKDNNTYLLEKNLEIIGRPPDSVKLLIDEYKAGNRIYWGGGSFEQYLNATENIRKDPYKIKIHGEPYTSELNYLRDQKKYTAMYSFDEQTASIILVPNLSEILSEIKCPVLAIFGEKDSQIDWRKTKRYYQSTLGANSKSKLTIKTFPNCGHVLYKCKTCGLDNSDLQIYDYQPCSGYYDTMSAWLSQYGFL